MHEVTAVIWKRIRRLDLQDVSDPAYFFPDPDLAKIFNANRFHVFRMSQCLQRHMARLGL